MHHRKPRGEHSLRAYRDRVNQQAPARSSRRCTQLAGDSPHQRENTAPVPKKPFGRTKPRGGAAPTEIRARTPVSAEITDTLVNCAGQWIPCTDASVDPACVVEVRAVEARVVSGGTALRKMALSEIQNNPCRSDTSACTASRVTDTPYRPSTPECVPKRHVVPPIRRGRDTGASNPNTVTATCPRRTPAPRSGSGVRSCSASQLRVQLGNPPDGGLSSTVPT